jgi:hypothetical protein
MADSHLTVTDSTGTPRQIDMHTVGDDLQQVVAIGDGVNPGRTVQINSDGAIRVESNRTTAAVLSVVASTTTSTTLLAANANRRGALIYNNSTAMLYLVYGAATATSTAFSVRVPANALYVIDTPLWTGQINGVWAAANGNAQCTDMTQ